ncbi:MAG: helix-hairpin-helix domain-containing protein [Anaerolineales bacterium]|nr:helix-hairpin-helix domain-containing protein [Anaerolineales bacterium]
MDEKSHQGMNINTAAVEELVGLPGIGPDLAARIVEQRPYLSEEDLLKVKGIGQSLLSRLKPLVSFNSVSGGQIHSEEPQVKMEDGEQKAAGSGEAVLIPPVVEEEVLEPELEKENFVEESAGFSPPVLVSKMQENKAQDQKESNTKTAPFRAISAGFSRGNTVWLLAGTSFISVIVAVLVTLLVLVLLNGTLRIDRNDSFLAMSHGVETLSGNLDLLAEDLAVVEQKLVALEGLSGRMTLVEGQIESIQSQVDQAAEGVVAMQSTVSELQDQTTVLADRISIFDSFFAGLQDLLGTIFNFEQPAVEGAQ